MRVQQAREWVPGPRAQREQPGQDVRHVLWLVHQVRLIRLGAEVTVGAREVHCGDHVSSAGPGLQQAGVRAGALQEPRGEQQQRERPGGSAGPGIPDLGHQCALAEILIRRACVGWLGKCHLPLSGLVAAVDGGSCGPRRGACPCPGSGRGCGPGWRGRPLLRLPRTARRQCEHDENSGDEQLGATDGRSHDWMPASRTCLVQAKLPEPAERGAVLILCRSSRCATIRRLPWRRAWPLSGAGWPGRAGSRRGRTSCRR